VCLVLRAAARTGSAELLLHRGSNKDGRDDLRQLRWGRVWFGTIAPSARFPQSYMTARAHPAIYLLPETATEIYNSSLGVSRFKSRGRHGSLPSLVVENNRRTDPVSAKDGSIRGKAGKHVDAFLAR